MNIGGAERISVGSAPFAMGHHIAADLLMPGASPLAFLAQELFVSTVRAAAITCRQYTQDIWMMF
jgi:hypothetical protein